MLQSYSHHDKELVYQIGERLEKDKFRVWLDRDNMFGSATRAMAHAIENSEVTLKRKSDVACVSHSLFLFACRTRTKKVATANWKRIMTTNSNLVSSH